MLDALSQNLTSSGNLLGGTRCRGGARLHGWFLCRTSCDVSLHRRRNADLPALSIVSQLMAVAGEDCSAENPVLPSHPAPTSLCALASQATCEGGSAAGLQSPHCYLENLWLPFLPINKSSQLKEWGIAYHGMFAASEEGKELFQNAHCVLHLTVNYRK